MQHSTAYPNDRWSLLQAPPADPAQHSHRMCAVPHLCTLDSKALPGTSRRLIDTSGSAACTACRTRSAWFPYPHAVQCAMISRDGDAGEATCEVVPESMAPATVDVWAVLVVSSSVAARPRHVTASSGQNCSEHEVGQFCGCFFRRQGGIRRFTLISRTRQCMTIPRFQLRLPSPRGARTSQLYSDKVRASSASTAPITAALHADPPALTRRT